MSNTSTPSKLRIALVSTCFAMLTACGGGGGGTAPVVAPVVAPSTPAVVTPTSVITLNLADTFTGSFTGNDFGVWSGDGGGDGGGAEGGGGAGDGEFVKVKLQFPYSGQTNGTLTWTVLKSQYNIAGATGTLGIRVDAAVGSGGQGGYKVITSTVNGASAAVRANQANIFISRNGVITGTLPLPINGGKDSIFTAFRFANATTPGIGDYAGQYAFVRNLADSGTGANQQIDGGVFNLNADGTGRFCDQITYSPTCPNGLDVKASFTDSNNNVVDIKPATVQSTPLTGTYPVSGSGLTVFKKFGTTGISFTTDVAFTRNDGKAITGAIYASRISGASPVNLNNIVGAYNVTVKELSGSSVLVASLQISAANIGGTFKVRAGLPGQSLASCTASETLTAGPVNGVLTSTSTTDPLPTYLFLLDSDTFVFVQPGNNMALGRRYANNPNVAVCPAN